MCAPSGRVGDRSATLLARYGDVEASADMEWFVADAVGNDGDYRRGRLCETGAGIGCDSTGGPGGGLALLLVFVVFGILRSTVLRPR